MIVPLASSRQLFFQQSYVIDKRITPRFINYERVDLWIGIGIVVLGAAAIFGFSAAVFSGRPEFGSFTNAAGVAAGLGKYVSPIAGDLFAIALLDASLIGATAVGLATAYAGADVLGVRHSLHRPGPKGQGLLRLLGRVYGPRWRPGPVAAANN